MLYVIRLQAVTDTEALPRCFGDNKKVALYLENRLKWKLF